jgi:membrane protein required for colicin V production
MWYDLVIFGLLVICTVRGATKGFAWQVAAIGALLICFFFAQTASLAIAPLIKLDPPLNRWVAMFVLYVGASFVSFGAARAVRGTLEKWQFVEFDKHLGALFGFTKGVAIALVITFFAVTLSETARESVLASYSGRAAGTILSALHPVMPGELHGVIDPYLEKLGREVVHEDGELDGRPNPQLPAGDEFGTPPHLSTTPDARQGTPGSQDTASTRPAPAGDGFGPAPPDFGPAPGEWPAQPTRPTANATVGQPQGSEVDRLLADVPDDLKQAALKAVRNTAPEHRDELFSKLRTAIPGVVKAVSTEWANGKPADAAPASRRDETLREIAGIYTTKLDAQRNIIAEAERHLQGLPDRVADAVVQDWYADLLRLSGDDPDPETDLSTRLDVRVTRQLKAFRVNPADLSADVRARLGSTPR